MTPSEHPVSPSIRALALTVAAAEDAGWAVLRIRGHLADVVPHTHPTAPVLADVLLSAHAVLAGVDADLMGLVDVWNTADLSRATLLLTRWLKRQINAT